ncbi:prolyl oligopeptidase family serine peptidase, partial [Flavobacteriaceae bacterium]|nr:prolyl oligopeptidase family serine peptidase [Flavobacteriaceae bacterium]
NRTEVFENQKIPELIEINATDGKQFMATLFYPENYDKRKKHPAVVFLHGGSRRQMLQSYHYSGYYSNAFALQQYFASQGYIAMMINYRSGIGYGTEFREADNYGISGASEVNDLIGVGEYLAERNDVDRKRIAIWGGSYGGYLTAHGLSRRSDLFSVGVDIHGVHNWNTELPTFARWYNQNYYPEIASLAFQSSPEAYLDGWKSPVLLIHGDDDRNVPFSESVVLSEQLRDRGVYFEQLIFPDEVHGFLLHDNWVKCLEATFEFIDRHIGSN